MIANEAPARACPCSLAGRSPRPSRQSCSARRLASCGASIPLAVGQASACHARTRPTRLGVTPYRLAGRSLRPSWASLTRMCLRSGIHACAGHIRRLNGRGNPSPPLNGSPKRERGTVLLGLRRLRVPRIPGAGVCRQTQAGCRSAVGVELRASRQGDIVPVMAGPTKREIRDQDVQGLKWRIDATSANPKGDADERAVLQRTIEADRCYILDRGSISSRLWNAINAAGSSYVCRSSDRILATVTQANELTEADRAASTRMRSRTGRCTRWPGTTSSAREGRCCAVGGLTSCSPKKRQAKGCPCH